MDLNPFDRKAVDFWMLHMRGSVDSIPLSSGYTLFRYKDGSERVCGCAWADTRSADMFVREPTSEERFEAEQASNKKEKGERNAA